MRKPVRLSESDMVRLVKKVVNEQQRNMGWDEKKEGGDIPVMTMEQFFNDPNWGGGANPMTSGDYWKVIREFSGPSIFFGKQGKKVKVKL